MCKPSYLNSAYEDPNQPLVSDYNPSCALGSLINSTKSKCVNQIINACPMKIQMDQNVHLEPFSEIR